MPATTLLAALMSESAELAELTLNDAVQLGTIRTRLAIQERRIELKRLYGVCRGAMNISSCGHKSKR